jgi:phenylalanyl-tRNA synthetase alpha chain
VNVLHKYEIAVLRALGKGSRLSLNEVMDTTGLGKDEVLWALQNLAAGGLAEVKREASEEAALSPEGNDCADKGLPERILAKRLTAGPVQISSLRDHQIGFMWAKRKGLVAIEKGMVRLTEKGREAAAKGMDDERILREIQSDRESYSKYRNTQAVEEFKKRGLLEARSREAITEVRLTAKGIKAASAQGSAAGKGEEGLVESVDRNVLKGGLWKGKRFREYNVAAPVEPANVAMRHPLRKVIGDLKESYTSLGFAEISGPIIEPSFWVFDHLFMPQDHPARDEQDTFFLANPASLEIGEKRLVGRMKKEHEQAWHMDWSEEIASQAVARTHTTSVTGRYVHQLVDGVLKDPSKYQLPIKLFTVGRNFRNENIDYKHLADFYQTDGIIIGRDLTLANLFDTLIRLYAGIGVKVKFTPQYYPFVEPGVHVLVDVNGEWMEVGGAGIIRREITGVGRRKVSVLAWGLALERLLLLKDRRITSIASLYNASAGWLRERSVR